MGKNSIEFYAGVHEQIIGMPSGIQAKILREFDLLEKFLNKELGTPRTKPLGNGLFEIRAKAKEGYGRCIFCYSKCQRIVVLYAFVKKTDATPKRALDLARDRKKSIES